MWDFDIVTSLRLLYSWLVSFLSLQWLWFFFCFFKCFQNINSVTVVGTAGQFFFYRLFLISALKIYFIHQFIFKFIRKPLQSARFTFPFSSLFLNTTCILDFIFFSHPQFWNQHGTEWLHTNQVLTYTICGRSTFSAFTGGTEHQRMSLSGEKMQAY